MSNRFPKNSRGGSRANPKSGRDGAKSFNSKRKESSSTEKDDSKRARHRALLNEEISDYSEEEGSIQEEADNVETAEEKRLRIAKEYINSLKKEPEEEVEGIDAEDLDRDIIADRLFKDALETANRLNYKISEQFPEQSKLTTRAKKAHQGAITSVVVDIENEFLYTASKDCSIVQWCLKTLVKQHTFQGGRKGAKKFTGHCDHILCLDITSDGKYLASGGKDKKIIIWDLTTLSFKGEFKEHRGAISGLAFRVGTYDLYSSSHDRTAKVWSVDQMGYVETLFGHQDMLQDIKALSREQCVTTGARDRSLRLWKIVDQTQLVFQGGISTSDKIEESPRESDTSKPLEFVENSLDKVIMLDEVNFVTGGDSGSLCLWNTTKKKPTLIHALAHGINPVNNQPYGITALSCVSFTDVFASGSSDGFLRVWQVTYGVKRSISPIYAIPLIGFVNSIAITSKDIKHHQSETKRLAAPVYHIIAGVGQEASNGRWERISQAKNKIELIDVPLKGHPESF